MPRGKQITLKQRSVICTLNEAKKKETQQFSGRKSSERPRTTTAASELQQQRETEDLPDPISYYCKKTLQSAELREHYIKKKHY